MRPDDARVAVMGEQSFEAGDVSHQRWREDDRLGDPLRIHLGHGLIHGLTELPLHTAHDMDVDIDPAGRRRTTLARSKRRCGRGSAKDNYIASSHGLSRHW